MFKYAPCLLIVAVIAGASANMDADCDALDGSETRETFSGGVHDVQCTGKSLKSDPKYSWENPDGLKIFAQPKEHTFNCLYNIGVCKKSGYDIFTTEGSAAGTDESVGRYRLSKALNDDLRALFDAQKGKLEDTKGIQVTVKDAIISGSVTTGGYDSRVIACGTISVTGWATVEDGLSSITKMTIGVVAGGTVVLGVLFYVYLSRKTKAGKDVEG